MIPPLTDAPLRWDRSRTWTTATVIALWGVLAFSFGAGFGPVTVDVLWTFVHTVAAVVLVAVACRVTVPAAAAVPVRRLDALAPL